jgi:hypothetical protein
MASLINLESNYQNGYISDEEYQHHKTQHQIYTHYLEELTEITREINNLLFDIQYELIQDDNNPEIQSRFQTL